MRGKTLATLMKLRAAGTAAAQSDLARAATARREAAEQALDAMRRVKAETTDAVPVTYGTWLALQLALRQQMRAAEAAAADGEDRAREALVEARREERVVERLVELRTEARQRDAARREAAALDEAGLRRRT